MDNQENTRDSLSEMDMAISDGEDEQSNNHQHEADDNQGPEYLARGDKNVDDCDNLESPSDLDHQRRHHQHRSVSKNNIDLEEQQSNRHETTRLSPPLLPPSPTQLSSSPIPTSPPTQQSQSRSHALNNPSRYRDDDHRRHEDLDDTGLAAAIAACRKQNPLSNHKEHSNTVQVINISPQANLEQLTNLFGILGDILQIELYNSDHSLEKDFKVCFVKFAKRSSATMALHLSNTVFIDRALVVLPYEKHDIPDKETALENYHQSEHVVNYDYGVMNQVVTGAGGAQFIATIDPRYTALGISQYPHLPISTEPTRLEEIRRTVYVGNLDSTLPPEKVLNFFNGIGEVKYIRLAGDETQPTRFAFVEYTHQTSLANAVQHNGFMLGSRSLKINHSNNSIVKPAPSDDTSRRNRDHSSRRHRDKDRDRDRDRRYYDSRSRRSRSRSPIERRRSRSPSDRRRSSSRDRHRRSRSRDAKHSRRRSRSRDIKRRSRSRTPDRVRSRRRKTSRR